MSNNGRSEIVHRIGPTGLVALEIMDGSVRVRGTEGEEARVSVHGATGDVDEDFSDLVKVRRDEDELHVDVRATTLPGRSGFSRRGQTSMDVDIEMPREGRLAVSGVSADVRVSGVQGHQSHRTVSGALDARDVEGEFTVQGVSGDLRIEGGTYLLEAVTTSGDVQVKATLLRQSRFRSISGDVDIAAEFGDGASHRVETVSGDLRVAPLGGLKVVARGISTRVHSQLAHKSAFAMGRREVVVGDGHALLEFRSMSGDVSVVEAEPGPAATRTPPPTAPSTTESSPTNQLSLLQALERGEIDVEEATRLLEEMDHD